MKLKKYILTVMRLHNVNNISISIFRKQIFNLRLLRVKQLKLSAQQRNQELQSGINLLQLNMVLIFIKKTFTITLITIQGFWCYPRTKIQYKSIIRKKQIRQACSLPYQVIMQEHYIKYYRPSPGEK